MVFVQARDRRRVDRNTVTGAVVDLEGLRRLLTMSGVEVRGELAATLLAGGRSNVTFKVCDETSLWVVRRPPLSALSRSAHDMVREYTVVKALRHSAVPVAQAVACDADGSVTGSPLCVVEFVPGRVIRYQPDLVSLDDESVRATTTALIEALVALHAIDVNDVGLQTLGNPAGFATRQVKLWTRQWHKVKTRELADVQRLTAALLERAPATGEASIVHGDFRIDNAILDPVHPSNVLAIVDWEMSTLGDPLTDIALACAYRATSFDAVLGGPAAWTSDRLPSGDDIANLYAHESGRELSNWPFYMALANLKIAVLAEGIGHRAQQDSGAKSQQILDATPSFVAAGLRALGMAA